MDRKVFQEQYNLLGDSEAIHSVIDKITQIAPTDITVLLQGESGVGKDVAARAIHGLSNRKDNNLVIVNCGAIPEGIIESELFGHEKGAFTGAHESRKGYFEMADGGTIFLDEIGETPKNVQVKLLRILESGEFFRVGSSKILNTDVRIIGASNKDLWEIVKDGDFREDLYYRLDTVKIKVPPLRERTEDIIPIFRKFVNELSAKHDSVFKGLSEDAKELLTSYRWPGNIRELRNVAEQLVVLEKSQYVDREKLKKYLKGRQHEGLTDNLPVRSQPSDAGENEQYESMSHRDRELIYRALVELRGDINDLKKMMGSFFYNTFSRSNIRGMLPTHIENEMNEDDEYGIDIGGGKKQRPQEDYSPFKTPISEHQPANVGSEGPSGYGEEYADAEAEADNGGIDSELKDFFGNAGIPSIEETERFLIKRALEKFEGNRRKASEALGISERTLYRKLDQYGVE